MGTGTRIENRESEAPTLAAILTSIGQGGIAVLRVVGPDAIALARELFRPKSGAWPPPDARRLHYGHIIDGDEVVDEVLLRLAPGEPPSAEIDCHGGVVAVQRVLECLVRRGARAVPAEALLDSQARGPIAAEAARAIIQATTPLGVETLFDQLDGALERALAELASTLGGTPPPEGFTPSGGYSAESSDLRTPGIPSRRCETFGREGTNPSGALEALRGLLATTRLGLALWQPRTVALIGPTNAGKSTLFNALAREDRMIVSPIPGTTRDAVSAEVAIGGLPVWLTDTAGEREPGSEIEAEAIARGRQAGAAADLALLVADGSVDAPPSLAALLSPPPPRLLVVNKSDLGLAPWADARPEAIRISAQRGDGLEVLCDRIVVELVGDASYQPGRPAVFTEHQAASLRRAEQAAASGAIDLARDIIDGLLTRAGHRAPPERRLR